jgi:hypothetical protein
LVVLLLLSSPVSLEELCPQFTEEKELTWHISGSRAIPQQFFTFGSEQTKERFLPVFLLGMRHVPALRNADQQAGYTSKISDIS